MSLFPKNFVDGQIPISENLEGVRLRKVDYDMVKSSLVSDSSSDTPIFGELTFNASLTVEFIVKRKDTDVNQ